MPESIVVGTDGSESAMQAVSEAIRLAKALGADLHIVSAYASVPMQVSGATAAAADLFQPLSETRVSGITEEAASEARLAGVPVTTYALEQNAADALVRIAMDVGASMIVVGNRGMHGARRLLGSVPNTVAHHAHCSVLIVDTGG